MYVCPYIWGIPRKIDQAETPTVFCKCVTEDEGQNFEQGNFKMADCSNLKINKFLNVERPILRELLKQEMKN